MNGTTTETVQVRALDPQADAPLVHAWVDDPRARFWGMVGHTVAQVAEIYAYVDSLPHHHAHLVSYGDRPVALLQTYRPEHDPVGECYQVEPGDFGLHLLVAPTDRAVEGFRGRLLHDLGTWAFADPTVQRLVVEPDLRNDKAIRRIERTGFTLGPEIVLPEKRARLAFLQRAVFEQSVPA